MILSDGESDFIRQICQACFFLTTNGITQFQTKGPKIQKIYYYRKNYRNFEKSDLSLSEFKNQVLRFLGFNSRCPGKTILILLFLTFSGLEMGYFFAFRTLH